jgi:hypothetical protein
MKSGGETYCNKCCLIIAKGERMTFAKRPGTDGSQPDHYQHFHNRQKGDCYFQYLRDEVIKRNIPVELVVAP